MHSRSTGPVRLGFTLIELLVVIAIILVLVSITLPSLGWVRHQLREAQCQRNLSLLSRGLVSHAMVGGGWLPSGPIEVSGSQWRDDPDRGSPIELYDARRPTASPPANSDEGWYGQGIAWKSGFVDTGQTFYCPQREDKGRGYRNDWPGNISPGDNPVDKTRIVGSYAYRGGLWSHKGTEHGPLNLDSNSGRLALIADYPGFSAMWHNDGYNVAFLDTHVEFIPTDRPLVYDSRVYRLWEEINAYWDE